MQDTVPYPVVLNLTGKRVVVVGGGNVAARRVEGLLGTGAAITVVAPALNEGTAAHVKSNAITWTARKYEPGDLIGAFLVHAATDDGNVNARVVRAASDVGALVCRADEPSDGSFITPSVIRRGEMTIAVATGGASPTFSALVREQIESVIGPDYSTWLQLFATLRPAIQQIASKSDRRKTLERIMSDPPTKAAILAGDLQAAETAARLCI